MTVLAAIIAAVVSWTALRILLRRAAILPLDRPNARSLHVHPVPRGGGLAIWAGWFAGTLWLPGAKPWLGPLIAVIAISLLDDYRGIHPALRLAVQGVAAAAWVWLAAPPLNSAIAVLGIVWMANLYNFMDGSDGLAGTMAVVGFGAYAAAAWLSGAAGAATFLALSAATVPFLAANLPPARVILGDVGAVPLGFLAAIFGIAGWQAAMVAGVVSACWSSCPSSPMRPLTLASPTGTRRPRLGGASRASLPAPGAWRLRAMAARSPLYAALMVGSRSVGGSRCCVWSPDARYCPVGRLRWHSRGWCLPRSSIIGVGEVCALRKVRANWRVWLAFVHDVCAAAIAWAGLYWLRSNIDLHEPQLSDMVQTLAWILPLQAGIFLVLRPLSRASGVSRACPTCSGSCSPRGWAQWRFRSCW